MDEQSWLFILSPSAPECALCIGPREKKTVQLLEHFYPNWPISPPQAYFHSYQIMEERERLSFYLFPLLKIPLVDKITKFIEKKQKFSLYRRRSQSGVYVCSNKFSFRNGLRKGVTVLMAMLKLAPCLCVQAHHRVCFEDVDGQLIWDIVHNRWYPSSAFVCACLSACASVFFLLTTILRGHPCSLRFGPYFAGSVCRNHKCYWP